MERISTLSAKLGVETPVKGLKLDELLDLVGQLEQRVAALQPPTPPLGDAPTDAPTDTSTEPAAGAGQGATVETPKPNDKPPVDLSPPRKELGKPSAYQVGKCALTTARGVLKSGTPLRDTDVDDQALRALVNARLVVPRVADQAGES
jgi:hypothetical protein